MSEFQISRSTRQAQDKDVEVLDLKGQLDAHTFPSLQKELEALGADGRARVVLNCSQLEYISSAGLGVLKKMTREFRGREGDIRLAQLTEKINNVVNLLGFSQVIDVYDDLDAAVQSFLAD